MRTISPTATGICSLGKRTEIFGVDAGELIHHVACLHLLAGFERSDVAVKPQPFIAAIAAKIAALRFRPLQRHQAGYELVVTAKQLLGFELRSLRRR